MAQLLPIPTPIYRILHVENLATLLARGALHAPNHVPPDGLVYSGIHAMRTQADRGVKPVPCGPGGIILDYVGFYFGPRSPMLFRVHTGYGVAQVDQSNIVYVVSTAQAIAEVGLGFVFTDRHSLARVAAFRDDLGRLGDVDFLAVNATQWNATAEHPDRQEKKQAEFLVYRSMPWQYITEIGVLNAAIKTRVDAILAAHPGVHAPIVSVRPSWYY